MKSPHVIQLSQLRAPKVGRGRPYTVDFGIAKPLHVQLLSYLLTQIRTLGWTFARSNKPFKSLAWGLVALYGAVGISLIPSGRIVYADPIVQAQPQPLAMLTMPVIGHVEPLPTAVTPLADNLSNLYAYGNCTAYVASKLPVPSDWGDAYNWGVAALAQGYTVSDVPLVGSIAWNTTDSYLGHVALVEAVDGDQVTVSEMNYQGLGVVDSRVANPGEFRFIYL